MKQPTLPKTIKNLKKPAMTANIVFLVFALLLGFAGGWIGSAMQDSRNNDSLSQQVTQRYISSESDLIANIAKEVGQSVVSVNVTSQANVQSFFGFNRNVEQQSAGTGFILNKDGIIVTNRHVVPAGISTVSVTLSDGTELNDVEVLGRTNDGDTLDVAFLKVKDKKGKDLVPVKLGDSSKTKVGEKVVAIGNALGQFQNTVTAGIISGYGREVEAGSESGDSETLTNLFQTDASINQGNSGGPLVNTSGEVIAINTAVAGSAENIGFAIPINDIRGLIEGVLSTGKLQRPYLGVRYVNLTDDYAYQYNLDTKRGAYLAPSENNAQPSILPDSPAAKADLKEKDIITKVGDTPINENNSLSSALGKYKVGDKVTLIVVRDNSEIKVQVTLEAAPEN